MPFYHTLKPMSRAQKSHVEETILPRALDETKR